MLQKKDLIMAKISQGIGGPLSGRVGPVVGYMWKHRACLRSLPQHFNYPNTESQQQQRDWFVSMVRFASRAKEALRLGLRQQADQAGMTEGNYFILNNKRHFRRVGDSVDIDYARLRLAEGHAADVYFREPRFEAGEVVSVDFEKNSLLGRASGDDLVYLYVYAPVLADGLLSAPVERRCKRVSISLPAEWSGVVVHLYGFVVDRAGRASGSTYIGEGRVNHFEDRSRYRKADANWQEFVDIAASNNGGVQDAAHVDDEGPSLRADLDTAGSCRDGSPGFI